MGLLNSMINIIGKGVAKRVGEVVEKAVADAVKPAAAKFAEKQADLIDAVTKNVEAACDATDEDVLAQWETLAPEFPKWSCGGNHLRFETETSGDEKFTYFYVDTAEANIIAYKAVLVANGFLPKWRSNSNQTWYKNVGGRYPAIFIELWDEDNFTYRLAFYEETEKEIAEAARS